MSLKGIAEDTAMSTLNPKPQTPAPKGSDRRRHPRIPEERPAWVQRGSNSAAVEMVDLSTGGACFLTDRPLHPGRSVRLQIGHGRDQAVIDGIIVRQTERPDGKYEVGMRVDDSHGFEMSQRFPSRNGRVTQF